MSSLLPTIYAAPRRRSTRITVRKLFIRIETTAFNTTHDELATKLADSQLIRGFYDFGTLMGVLGTVAATAILLYTSWQSVAYLLQKPANLVKRDPTTPGPSIIPIIPGLTVPLSHLPSILAAVFLSQLFHELGHALAGALESTPIHSAGASLTLFLLPSAFVAFPSHALAALSPRARARIVAAGPLHNITAWSILSLLAYLNFGKILFRATGYQDVSAAGIGVLSISPNSPLHAYIPQGSLITQVDDTTLGFVSPSHVTPQDTWTAYLTSPDPPHPTRGWCVENALLDNPGCCGIPTARNASTAHLSCFMTLPPHPTRAPLQVCVDPVPVLTPVASPRSRCAIQDECTPTSTCVRPDVSAQLLRLHVISAQGRSRGDEGGEVMLWSGPREEVWEEVHTTPLLPLPALSRILPLWLPALLQTFFEYLTTASLSLYLFNLLPLPFLDGAALWGAGWEVVAGVCAGARSTGARVGGSNELETMEMGEGGGRW